MMNFDVQKYFESSTIHGLVYITRRYHLIERIFWIISLIFSVICTSILIVELIIKVSNFPIVTYMSDQSIPVSEIDFPAITVCPRLILDYHKRWRFFPRAWYEKHTLKEIFYTFEEALHEFADERRFGNISYVEFLDRIENGSIKPNELGIKLLKSLQVVDLIANRGTFAKINFSISSDDFLNDINVFFKEFTTDIEQLIFFLYRNQEYVCEIITQWGLCYTYNIAYSHKVLKLNTTSDDFHYVYTSKMHHYDRMYLDLPALPPNEHDFPVRVFTTQKGLWIGFDKDPDTNFNAYQNDFNGFICIFHKPFELPSRFSKIVKFDRKFQTKILVDPQIDSIDESLLDYEPDERNCYLENEKILKFFKFYTKNNCESECLSDLVLSRCGCVEFFMIRNSTTRICRANERSCFKKAEEDFEAKISSCKCFETCDQVNYKYDLINSGIVDEFGSSQEVGFHVQYKTTDVNQFIRKKQFTIFEFLSFVGGILGLFAGFSALSFVEFVYWFGIRVFIEKYLKSDSKIYSVHKTLNEPCKLAQTKTSLKLYFIESSVHGMGYIFDSSRISKILWIFFILTSMTFCLHLILGARDAVPESRVIAYDDSFKLIENIPFPAITIVPPFMIKSSYSPITIVLGSKVPGKYDTYNETTYRAYKRKITQFFFCWGKYEAYGLGYKFSFVPYFIEVLRLNTAINWFRQQHSVFNGKYEPKFAEVRTPNGQGFTFNMIDAEEMFNFEHISADFNYTTNVTTYPINLNKIPTFQKFPLKFYNSDKVEISMKIRKPIGDFERCIKQSIYVHHFDSSPTLTVKSDFTPFDFGTILDIIVTPEITRTDEKLKKLNPKDRGCYFDGEKSLHFFKRYSQKNCEIECLANLTFSECGCVDIDQPFKTQKDICMNISRDHSTCVNELHNYIFLTPDLMTQSNCGCLPTCNSISYTVKHQTMHEKEIKHNKYGWQKPNNETIINVRMNMDEIILYRRYQQFTSSDVVSYVGGLLGLFAGISMLSIVEFFYFFTVRLSVDLWRIF